MVPSGVRVGSQGSGEAGYVNAVQLRPSRARSIPSPCEYGGHGRIVRQRRRLISMPRGCRMCL
ncbi:hypothetical protein CHELA1G2_13582 [Hyphomicrobiales bacterium]|nr:hypothetical protein CHELA1G2_13582 [Hyphomicrobiales bacterium]